ncbi:holo-ACP synthase [Alkalihalobacillus hemicellulosilyticus]|uniref:Holo-[acyl-carrier-protein] synthase n=1 Tax=Halalkalibacter hemicellulosilyticusJCM 9152 TaxID=1236971 RepID=W4QB49_9BACI|nr:holo-ACP synthase [Halalkalibacter hemicellulosilyticus]GAE28893.1 holo-[acyl-carrier protein] synthase [Halalkalibacter hemicellulosilyticusJCM 9152]
MIKGIGIDIVEIERIEQIVNRKSKFATKILTEKEHELYQTLKDKRQLEFLAGRFAAKEAFVKAVGTGISKQYSWHDITIMREESGKPVMEVKGVEGHLHLSISHSRSYAIAQVIIESL